MANKNDKTYYDLYNALKADGAVTSDWNTFHAFVGAAGKEGYENRKRLYDALKADGAVSAKSYEEFHTNLFRNGQASIRKGGTASERAKSMLYTDKPVVDYVHRPEYAVNDGGGQPARKGAGRNASALVRGLYETDDARSGGVVPKGKGESALVRGLRAEDDLERKTLRGNASRELVKDTINDRPVVNTGDEGANTYVTKTTGQLMDEIGKSARDVVNGSAATEAFVSNMVNQEVMKDAVKRADEAYGKGNWHLDDGYGNSEMFYSRKANEEMSDEAMLGHLEKSVKDSVMKYVSDPNVAEKIRTESARLGVDPMEYVKNSIAPVLYEKIQEKLPSETLKKYLPRGRFDYIMGGMLDSTLGTLGELMTKTESQRMKRQEATSMTNEGNDPYFQAGVWDKAGRGAVSFLTDAPLYAMAGAGSGAVTERLFGSAASQLARAANQTLLQRVGEGVVKGIVHGGVTGFQYGAFNGAVQNYSTGEDTSIGGTVKAMLKGGAEEGASFAVMEGIGGAVSPFGRGMGLTGKERGIGQAAKAVGKKLTFETVKTGMEGIGMATGGVMSDQVGAWIEGRDATGFTVEGTLESCASAALFKLLHTKEFLKDPSWGESSKGKSKDKSEDKKKVPGKVSAYIGRVRDNIVSSLMSDKARQSGYVFSYEERWQLQNAARKAGMDIDGSFTRWASRTKGKTDDAVDGKEIATYYDAIMKDPTISWDTKAKFTTLVTGTMPSSRPMMDYITFSKEQLGDDAKTGRWRYVNEYAADGTLLSKRQYDSMSDRERIVYELTAKREEGKLMNVLGVLIGQDMNESGLQEGFFRRQQNDLDYYEDDVNSLAAAMGQTGTAEYEAFRQYAAENGRVGSLLKEVCERNGMTMEELDRAMKKDPMKRNDKEAKVLVDLRKTAHDLAFPKDKVHEEQSREDGKEVAGENGLGTDKPNTQAVAAELDNLKQAENELQAMMDQDDTFKENFASLQGQGMTNPQIYQWMMDNGLTEEQLAPFARYINAVSRVQGMQKATAQAIDQHVSAFVSDWSFHGRLNGEETSGDTVLVVQDKDGRTLLVGSGEVSYDEKDGRAKEGDGDMLVCFDQNSGEVVYVKADDTTLFQRMTAEELAADERRRVENINNAPYEEAAQQQAAEEAAKAASGEGVPAAAEAKPAGGSEESGKPAAEGSDTVPGGNGPKAAPEGAADGGSPSEGMRFKDGRPVPMTEDSKGRPTADYGKMTAEEAAEYLSGTFGENAGKVVDGKIRKAEEALKKAREMEVDYGADDADIIEAESMKRAAVEAAERELKLFGDVKKEMAERKAAEEAAKAEAERKAAEAEAKAEAERKAAEEAAKRKAAEEAARSAAGEGGGDPSAAEVSGPKADPKVKERYDKSKKVVGRKGTITLADGTKISGTYVYGETSGLTPSHDPMNGFAQSEGFPVNADGGTANSRSYKDANSRAYTIGIGNDFNGLALQNVPVVQDGVVLSGNGTTMAKTLAEQRGTDSKYYEALMENAGAFGLSWEDIDGVGRKGLVYFVPDDRLPLDSRTFDLFNKKTDKNESNTATAVRMAKTLSRDDVGAIVAEIDGNGTLENFFNNPKAINGLLETLVRKGVIGRNDLAALKEGADRLSPQGKELVKNVLLGTVFTPDAINMMGEGSQLKGKVVAGIRPILENLKLGDYSLKDEVDQAIRLMEEARQSGMSVDDLLRQGDMVRGNARDRYSAVSQMMALALDGKVADFRDLLDDYNRQAAAHSTGEEAMFGDAPTKEKLVKDFLDYRGWKDYALRESDEKVEAALKDLAVEITRRTGVEVVTDLGEAQHSLEEMEAAGADVSYHRETDEKVLSELENGRKVKVFRAMQVIDGKLYPPMAAKVDGKLVEPNEIGVWVRSDEKDGSSKNVGLKVKGSSGSKLVRMDDAVKGDDGVWRDGVSGKPLTVDKSGEPVWYFLLEKGSKTADGKKGTDTPAAYNPYWHTSRSPLNDQFKSAWIRPNLVVVECEVPESELSSGYWADHAKDSVGEVDWKSGSVSKAVYEQTGRARKVILSRWCKPLRVVSDAEFAKLAKDYIGDADVVIPENVVTPKQRIALEAEGLKIGAPEKGINKSEQILEALKAGLEVDTSLDLFKTKDGEVYGFTDGKRIYLDTERMHRDTPLHEYGHLWAKALKRVNPKEWEHVKDLFDSVDGLMDEVKRSYPELEGDRLYEEMVVTYSGREGAKRLEEAARRIAAEDGKTVTESVRAKSFVDRVTEALKRYWKAVSDMLHVRFTSAEDVADMMLADWARGFDPRKAGLKDEDGKDAAEGEGKPEGKGAAGGGGHGVGSRLPEGGKPSEPAGDLVGGLEGTALGYRRDKGKKVGQSVEMTPEEKAAARDKEMQENPLTREEIDSYDTGNAEDDEFTRENAIDYLNGDVNPLTALSYLKIFEHVRNTRQDGEGDSGTADTAHVDGGSDETGGPGGGGKPSEPVDTGRGGTDVPGLGPDAGADGKERPASADGAEGHQPVGGKASEVDGVPAGTKRRGRSSKSGGKNGTDGQQSPRGNDGGTGETKRDARSEFEEAETELKDVFAQIKSLRKRNRKDDAGKLNAYPGLVSAAVGELAKKMLPRDKEEMVLYGKLMKACAKYAYKGLKMFGEKAEKWFEGMNARLHDTVKETYGDVLTDEDVDNFIKSLWNTKYTIDGRRQTIEQWAAEMGQEKLRAALRRPIAEKRKAQQEAESVEVKVGDADNIAETLPFLLPEQQDDVMKAERRFFGGADDSGRKVDSGIGMLFTNGTGTGKTYTGLGIAKRFIKQGKGRVLIVTPSQEKVTDWTEDAKNLGIQLNPLVQKNGKGATSDKGENAVITTYANFRANKALLEDTFDLVIYDESHKLMENKDASESATTKAHYKMTNKDFFSAKARLTESHPLWREELELMKEQQKLMRDHPDYESAVLDRSIPDSDIKRIEQIQRQLGELKKEQEAAMPEIDRKARESVGKTKVVFLSATPFNMRENIEYAEGYLFNYGENKNQEGLSEDAYLKARNNAKNGFFRQWFPHGEEIGSNGKVRPRVTDADKNDEDERRFADHLMDSGVMSGRTIDNGYDYSRDFPTVSVSHANDFNKALREATNNGALSKFAGAVFGDYNTMSVVYETMKVSAIAQRLKDHMALGRKIVVFHRRVNDSKGVARPPFRAMLDKAEEYASMLSTGGSRAQDKATAQRIREEIDKFERKYGDLLNWEQSLDYRMPRQQLKSLLGDAHQYTYEEMYKYNKYKEEYLDKAFSGESGISAYEAGRKFGEACFDIEDADVVKDYKPHRMTDEEAEELGVEHVMSKSKYDKLNAAYEKTAKEVRRGIEDNIKERIASGELKIELDGKGKRKRKVGLFAGEDTKGQKHEDVTRFNDDDSGMDVIVVQEASGKEGISLHDRTGKHQRVMVNLALPQSPIAFIQAEGRIYRIGQMSNAIFEYPLLGIDNEIQLFAARFNGRAATTENLALGSMARGLKDAITRGVLAKSGNVPLEGQGFGGKEWDLRDDQRKQGYDAAVEDYRNNKSHADQTIPIDGASTPEPLGYKMVEWAQMTDGENTLEPSAGTGTISRYIPTNVRSLSIEPDTNRRNTLMLLTGAVERGTQEAQGRRTQVSGGTFEDLNGVNKFDTIVMNSPNGTENALAKSHLEKAIIHLNDSGRIVAVLPMTEDMRGFVSKLMNENPSLHVSSEVILPDCAFSKGGVSQKSYVVTIDKLNRDNMRKKWKDTVRTDLSGAKDMDDFFRKLKDVKAPDRVIDPAARYIKHAQAAKSKLDGLDIFKSRGGGVVVDDSKISMFLPNKLYYTMKRAFSITGEGGREYSVAAFHQNRYPFKDIVELNMNILSQYMVCKQVMDMTDAEIAERCFYGEYAGKKLNTYVNDIRKFSEAVTKMIRGISGRTDSQLERAYKGEDIDNAVTMTPGMKLSMKDLRSVFESNNGDEELSAVFDKVYDVAKDLGMEVSVYNDPNTRTSAYYSNENALRINANFWNASKIVDGNGRVVKLSNQKRAEVLTHELIHSVTSYALYWNEHDPERLSDDMRKAADELTDLYERVVNGTESYKLPSYCKTNVHEFVAEGGSNPEVRDVMKRMGLWKRFVNAVKRLFSRGQKEDAMYYSGLKDEDFTSTTVYNELTSTLDKFLNNFDRDAYDAFVAISGRRNDMPLLRQSDGAPGVEHLGSELSSGTSTRQEESAEEGITHFRKGNDGGGRRADGVSTVVDHVYNVSRKLGGRVNVVESAGEVTDPEVKRRLDRGEKVTGWYDGKTGKVYLYLPNVHDRYTAEKTIWHETVGHKGMRELIGDENYGRFLRDVWYSLDEPGNERLRELVEEEMRHSPLDYENAVEEGIARLVEDGKGEPGFWNTIKNKVTDLLHEVGYRIAPNTKDVKYLLWLAKNRQKHAGDAAWEMRAEAVRHRLERAEVPSVVKENGMMRTDDGLRRRLDELSRREYAEATDGEIHFRTAPSTATALDRYHRALDAHGYMATESFMDNMASLKAMMLAMETGVKDVRDVKSSENPYMLQNTMQGAMSDAADLFERNVMRPLDKAMADVLDAFDGRNDDEKVRDFNLYMITKHGLERNRVLYVRDNVNELRKNDDTKDDADSLQAQWNAEKKDLGDRLRRGDIDLKGYYSEMDEWIRDNVDPSFNAGEHDYSGLHAIQGVSDDKKPYDDDDAITAVMDKESSMESTKKGSVEDFWKKVNTATRYAIDTDYRNGLMSRELKDHVDGMFDWYVPLRKHDEKMAEDVYGYITEKGDPKNFIGGTLMRAKGHKYLSETNVLAQIGMLGNRAIHNGGRNAVKQAFARFVRSHPDSGLVTETSVWYVEDPATKTVKECYPVIKDEATADEVNQAVRDFNDKMQKLKAKGLAKKVNRSGSIGYKFEHAEDKSQHIVDVMIAGRKHSFVVNGNPRAAQALNGLLENEGSAVGKAVGKVTRFMAQACTSFNPEFMARNIIRDAQFASSNVAAKEGASYALKWGKYYAQYLGKGFAGTSLKDFSGSTGLSLYRKYRDGKLDMSDKMHRYFKEFMENGGETGWVQLLTMKDWEKKYKTDIRKERNAGLKAMSNVEQFLFGNIERMNEVAENAARFATYCASRESGRTKVRSAYDAKEVSVNFNRHGSGNSIRSFKNGEMHGMRSVRRDMYGYLSSYLRQYQMFFNASVQSMNQLMTNVKSSPMSTMATMMAAPFALGVLAAMMNNMLIDQEDEKGRDVKDPYGELPDYVRRNSLCIYTGNGRFMTIPLAIELRAFYGLGDLAAGMTFSPNVSGQKSPWMDAVGSLSQLVPVADFLGNSSFGKHPGEETAKAVAPSALVPFLEWSLNSDWKGVPIERRGDWTENMPAWQRAYSSTPEYLMDMNKKANAMTNDVAEGNENMLGNSFLDAATNPSMLSHFTGGFGGGVVTFSKRMIGLMRNGSDTEVNNVPFLRSIYFSPSERTSLQRTRTRWYDYKEDMAKTMANVSRLKKKGVPVDERMRNVADYYRFQNSKDAEKVRIIKAADKQLKRWTKLRGLSTDNEAIRNANANMDRIMTEAVEAIDRLNE